MSPTLPQDREVLQNFTTTIVRFCILRNPVHDHFYTRILTNMGLFHSNLFEVLMVYSAFHCSYPVEEQTERTRSIQPSGHSTDQRSSIQCSLKPTSSYIMVVDASSIEFDRGCQCVLQTDGSSNRSGTERAAIR